MTILRYQITEQSYDSGNSLVYQGRKENQFIALKMLQKDCLASEKTVYFKQDHQRIQNLNLPGGIDVYGLETDQHRWAIVLDDLPWTAPASLRLLQLLMTAPDTHYLFVVGSYRNKRVSETHPLILTMDQIQRARTCVNDMVREPWGVPGGTQLISDALGTPPDTDRTQPHLHNTHYAYQRCRAVVKVRDLECRAPQCVAQLAPIPHQAVRTAMNMRQTSDTFSILDLARIFKAAQAIAIENAQLHSTLEQRVVERTQDLLKKNEELEKSNYILETANRAKSIFLANMSHEIRTPLNAILGYAHILEQDPDLDIRQVGDIQIIAQNGRHLLNLINDVLDLSKIEANRMNVQASDFDLTALIDEVSKMFEVHCKEKNLDWRVEWRHEGYIRQRDSQAHSRLVVHGDEGKLRQVCINLLSNAVKFTEMGEVVLRIDQAHITSCASHITFYVIDTGIGIAEEDRVEIFSAFNQVVSAERREGTGLGLTIAQQLVALMGGNLAVESQPGVGSRFSFTLPFTQKNYLGSKACKPQGHLRRMSDGTSVKALVVDDMADHRAVLAYMLQAVGVDVEVIEDGRPVQEHIAAGRPDIVFMDIQIHSDKGVSAASHIIDTNGRDRPKLVAVSASALNHERQHYFAAGFDDFLPKPIVAEQIHQCLASLLPVEFVSNTSQLMVSAGVDVALPDDLCRGIKQAAETYRVTQLDRYFDALAQLGPSRQRLAECLRERKQHADMDGIINLLAQYGKRNKEHAGGKTPRNSHH